MGVRAIFQLDTPWTEDEVFELGYEQGADVMVFTHLKHRQVRLTRYDHDVWTILYANYVATVTPPAGAGAAATTPSSGTGYVATNYVYAVTSVDAATGQESLPASALTATTDLTLKGNFVTISWTANPAAERYNVYRKGGGAFGYIGSTADTSFVDDNIAPDFSQSFPVHRDPFGSDNSSDTDGNKPAVVTFWQQRAIYARSLNKPNGVWASQSANLFNFNVALPTTASDAITFAVSGRRVNAVLHLIPLKDLLILTTDMIFSVKGANGDVLTPSTIDITPENYRGASRVRPLVIDDVALFGTAKGGSIRTLNYEFQADGYRGNDLTVFAPHLFRNVNLVDLAWAEFPTTTVHAVMSDGDVRLLTWMREQEVWGWSKLVTDGEIESCCTVSESGEDRVYYVVKRGDQRLVEYTASPLWEDVADAVYLDSARTYSGEPKAAFTGLEHLEGRTINVLADGAVHTGLVVSGGGFTLPYAASKVVAGLPYEAWARTLPLGTAQPDRKGTGATVGSVALQVVRTRGIEVGLGREPPPGATDPTTSDAEIEGLIDEVKTRDLEPMGEPTRLFSGELVVDLEPGSWQSATVVVRQRHPLPMHVIGITPDYLAGD